MLQVGAAGDTVVVLVIVTVSVPSGGKMLLIGSRTVFICVVVAEMTCVLLGGSTFVLVDVTVVCLVSVRVVLGYGDGIKQEQALLKASLG
jgi:hypothetical protein